MISTTKYPSLLITCNITEKAFQCYSKNASNNLNFGKHAKLSGGHFEMFARLEDIIFSK